MGERLLGPTGGKRRKRLLLAVPFTLIAALVLAIAASAGPVGTAAGFEDDDGNLTPASPINFDWNSFDPVTWSPHPATTPTRQTDTKSTNGFQFKGIEDYPNPGATSGTTADTSFAGGTKQDDNCASVITNKPPNKDDLSRVYLASKVVNGQTFLELAWARIPQNSTSASAHVGFEFNQSGRARPADGRRHPDRLRLRGWLRRPGPDPEEVGHLRCMRGRQQQPALLGDGAEPDRGWIRRGEGQHHDRC
jgi:hypothetical protein